MSVFTTKGVFASLIAECGRRCDGNFIYSRSATSCRTNIFPVSHSLCAYTRSRCDCPRERALVERHVQCRNCYCNSVQCDNIDIIQDSPAQLLISLTMQSSSHTGNKGRIIIALHEFTLQQIHHRIITHDDTLVWCLNYRNVFLNSRSFNCYFATWSSNLYNVCLNF